MAQDSSKPALPTPTQQAPPDSTVIAAPSEELVEKEESKEEGTAKLSIKDWLSIIEIDPLAALIALASLDSWYILHVKGSSPNCAPSMNSRDASRLTFY